MVDSVASSRMSVLSTQRAPSDRRSFIKRMPFILHPGRQQLGLSRGQFRYNRTTWEPVVKVQCCHFSYINSSIPYITLIRCDHDFQQPKPPGTDRRLHPRRHDLTCKPIWSNNINNSNLSHARSLSRLVLPNFLRDKLATTRRKIAKMGSPPEIGYLSLTIRTIFRPGRLSLSSITSARPIATRISFVRAIHRLRFLAFAPKTKQASRRLLPIPYTLQLLTIFGDCLRPGSLVPKNFCLPPARTESIL
jgi:hypothetical protein